MVELASDDRAGMNMYRAQTGRDVGEFPLHADLYLPKVLFNVFDHVAEDDSGASLFLSLTALRQIMSESKSLSRTTEVRFLAMFESETGSDRFAALYDLSNGLSAIHHRLRSPCGRC
jgi:hypothetical protein